MTSDTDGEHYLLLRIELWVDVPEVVGIYLSANRAQEVARNTSASALGHDRWTLEEWRGSLRLRSVQLEV